MTEQSCKKCNCPIFWDKTISKSYTKKDGTKVTGWWRESLTKQEHNKERCEQFLNSKEFFEQDNIKRVTEEPKIEESKLKRTDLLDVPKILTIEEEQLIEVVARQLFESKKIIQMVAKDYNQDDVNLVSISKFALNKVFERRMKKLES